MRIFAVLVLICFAITASGQNPKTDNLRWNLGEGIDLGTNQSFAYSGSLFTSGNQSIRWEQKSVSSKFFVLSVSGSWIDVSKNGKVVFSIQDESSTGTLTFERKSSGIFVTMEFPKADPRGTRVKWNVSEITAN